MLSTSRYCVSAQRFDFDNQQGLSHPKRFASLVSLVSNLKSTTITLSNIKTPMAAYNKYVPIGVFRLIPTLFRFEEEYEKVVSKGDEAVVITLSSKLSATNSSAVQASKKFDGKVFVVDSMSATIGTHVGPGVVAVAFFEKE